MKKNRHCNRLEISQNKVKSFLDYSTDGELLWKQTSRRMKAGAVAGYLCNTCGYRKIKIGGHGYFAHRLVFLYHHGYLPECIDHIDGNRANNRIENLREATHTENAHNKKIMSSNRCGFKGVHFDKSSGRWRADISFKNKVMTIGRYESPAEAHEAYKAKAVELFGEFARFK